MNTLDSASDGAHPSQVSVVIPFFNDSKTVARALESVRAQTMQPLETLLVDDASRPDEFERMCFIVSEFPSLNTRILRQSTNRGPSAARNLALDEARGSHIAFLDADDAWHSNKLEIQVQHLESDPALFIIGTQAELGEDKRETTYHQIDNKRVTPRAQVLRNHFVTSSVMLRSNIGLRFREDLRYSEDNDLWSRVLLQHPNSGTVLQAPLSFFFKPPRSRLGASGKYWQMYKGQLRVYSGLRNDGLIPIRILLLSVVSCTFRFAVRMVRVAYSALGRVTARSSGN